MYFTTDDVFILKPPVVNPTEEDAKKDLELRDAFKKIAGEDLEIDAYELQDILNSAFLKG